MYPYPHKKQKRRGENEKANNLFVFPFENLKVERKRDERKRIFKQFFPVENPETIETPNNERNGENGVAGNKKRQTI